MMELKCTLNHLCHCWTDEVSKKLLYADRDGCLFSDDSYVRGCRNVACPFPVELVYSNLIEVPE